VTTKVEQIRGFLHARLRTATLRHDDEGTASLLNLLLRNYTKYSLFDQVWEAAHHGRMARGGHGHL
jgi:26S proteasome regulatory subunit N3